MGYTCSTLESVYSCDCAGCDCSSDMGGSNDPSNSSACTGFYMYVEASSPNFPNTGPFALDTPTFTECVGSVSFAYHMYGAAMGTLQVMESTDGATWAPIWSKTGDQGNSWFEATVDASPFVRQLRFEGTTGSNHMSDIAIDGVVVFSSPEECHLPTPGPTVSVPPTPLPIPTPTASPSPAPSSAPTTTASPTGFCGGWVAGLGGDCMGVIDVSDGVIAGDTTGASNVHQGSSNSPEHFYLLSLTDDAIQCADSGVGAMQISSCGSAYDTWLFLYDTAGNMLYSCDDCGACGVQTIMDVPQGLVAGDYVLIVEGYSTAYGAYTLSITCNGEQFTPSPSPLPTKQPTPGPTPPELCMPCPGRRGRSLLFGYMLCCE